MKKEAYLYSREPSGMVVCNTCQRHCHIPAGKKGWCQTRINEEGKLYSLIYGEISSMSINPIEKKPVYHFFPGSRWLSVGSVGCNFRCPGCQNWEISHWTKGSMQTSYLSPKDLVNLAIESDCLGISWTFNEPAIWLEYTLDSAKIAKDKGLYTNYVTNGSISKEAFLMIAPYLDVYRVDIKGFSDRTYQKIGHLVHFEEILRITKMAKNYGMHVEIVTNVIPGFNDDMKELKNLASWIKDTLGPDTPWHITRFFPYHKLSHISPTSIAVLEQIHDMGKKEGLMYVYLGNIPGHKWENTYCHSCGTLLIKRYVFDIIEERIKKGRCPECSVKIPGRFE